MHNKSWQYLKPGDIVDVVAPSSFVQAEFEYYYLQIKEMLAEIGLLASIPGDLMLPGQDLFSANSLEYRTNHLISSFTNSTSKAIWFIRGGYGSAKIIPSLEKIIPPEQAKLVLGFSDATALHLFLQNKWHWNSIHSPVLNQCFNSPDLLAPIKEIIFGDKTTISYHITPSNTLANRPQTIQAEITGGNLSLVQTSLATSYQINGNEKIIFLEDVNEQAYRIDRMLNHLLQAGVFDNARAVIFGTFTPVEQEGEPELCAQTIIDFAQTLDIPTFSLPIIGHGADNAPLPLGVDCQINIDGYESVLSCQVGGI